MRLAPANAQYRTTLALALDAAGRTDAAFEILSEAVSGGVADSDLLGTAIQLGLKLRRYQETLKHAEALALLRPNDPQIAQVVRQLRAASQTGD